jgi:4-hydroxy-tetrahydrodipicolinate synthase
MSHLPLKGIIPPLVTPLSERDSLDVGGLERLIGHVLGGGVHGLFLLGTTGEGPSLSHRLQREIVERSCRLVDGRSAVLVGVTDTSPVEALALTRHAADHGADAVVLAAPYYFPMHQEDLARFVQRFADESPLPVVLYNMPTHTKTAYELATVRRLMDHDNVVAVKDSSGQMLYFQELVELSKSRPGFSVLMGPEELLAPAVLMGGHGGVCGGANLLPSLYCEMFEAAVTGDLRLVHTLQQRMLRMSRKLYQVGPPPTSYLAGLKAALEALGICNGLLAEPLYELSEHGRAQIEQHLRDLGLDVSAASTP